MLALFGTDEQYETTTRKFQNRQVRTQKRGIEKFVPTKKGRFGETHQTMNLQISVQ